MPFVHSRFKVGDAQLLWTLFHGEQPVAEIVISERDERWFEGELKPRKDLEAFRPLFEKVNSDGREAVEFLLHIDGTGVTFQRRYDRAED